MREIVSKIVFLAVDIMAIAISIALAYECRSTIESDIFPLFDDTLSYYLHFYPVYIVPIILFAYDGIYTYHYDFWHESRLILRAILLSTLIIFAYLALSKTIGSYSRFLLLSALFYMIFIIPLFKRVVKFFLYRIGLWRKPAIIYTKNELLRYEIEENFYLGYKESDDENASTVFINSGDMNIDELKRVIDDKMKRHKEVLFIPLLNEFDLTQSRIYELSNIRSNFISLQNRLRSRYRRVVKYVFDYICVIVSLPLTLPLLALIAYLIKREEPEESVIFRQERIGKGGRLFVCYKFRTMKLDNEKILADYLQSYPQEALYYEKYHKLRNDPRVTEIGRVLRSTSLDELPQLLNVMRGEMSLVGPRPYLPAEEKKMNGYLEFITSVRPGITGLWQVSGRSETDFEERVETDIWYIRNWNLWLDIVVLLKTIKVVLTRSGAY
jgi:undecaprenyl-phosphate galactose phosphotransferase